MKKKHTLRNFTNLYSTEILCWDEVQEEVEGHVLGKGEMRKAYIYLGRQTRMEETAVEGSISVWENSGQFWRNTVVVCTALYWIG